MGHRARSFCNKVFYSRFVSTVGTVFSVFMELTTGNNFDFLKKKLSSLYVKAEMLIEQDGDSESVNKLLCEINDTYFLLEKAILSHKQSSKREFLSSNLSRLHSEKARLDRTPQNGLQR